MGKRGPKPKRREVIWSPELAYAIGLIATDGWMSGDGRHLAFVSKDIEQLKNLKKCLNLKVKIGIHKSGRKADISPCHRLQWGDVTLYNFLLNIGLMPNKSKMLGEIAVPDKFFFDFLRGSFDGDGSFYSYYDSRWKSSFMYYLSFTSASKAHIVWLRESLRKFIGVTGHTTHVGREGQKVFNLRYAKKEAFKILQLTYPNSNVTCLSRKRLKIERALRIVGESLPKCGTKT